MIPNSPLKFLLAISKPHRLWAIGALSMVTLAQGFMSLSPFIIKQIVDGFTAAIPRAEQLDLLAFWAIMYVVLQASGFLAWRASGFIGMEWLTRANATAYNLLYRYISKHSHSFFLNRFAGALSNKISNASDGTERLLERSVWGWYPELISLIIGSALLFSVDPYIAGVFLVIFAVMVVVNYVMVRRRRPHVVAYAEASSTLRGDGVDYLTNITAARQYSRNKEELARIEAAATTRRLKDVVQWRMSEWSIAINNVVVVLMVAALLFYVFVLFQNAAATAGDVILIITVIGRLTYIIVFLGNTMNGFIRVYGEIEEGLRAVLVPYEIEDRPGARNLTLESGRVEWSNVNFKFDSNKVFKDFNLIIEPGERIGLVGPSGAGKTTFVSLLLRQHDLDGGTITIDWQDISMVTQDSLRENIAVVPQEPFLFHRTIRENIAYGKPSATQEEIEAVAQKAQAHDFIVTLPDGYDTLVGERGVKLSGGQRQRIAIARAMLKNAPILVLDEATSALDSESEVAIQKALHELMEGKTVVAIAHRLSTLREMDRIIVLEAGRIVEDGTHAQLQKQKGVYAGLWSHQAGGFLQD